LDNRTLGEFINTKARTHTEYSVDSVVRMNNWQRSAGTRA